MTPEKEPAKRNTIQLRELAELRATQNRRPRSESARMSVDELQRLLFEMDVHQEELEIQNEELLRIQTLLQESRDAYADLYDFAPVGYVTVDEQGIIREANLASAVLLNENRSTLIGSRIAIYFDLSDRQVFYEHFAEVLLNKLHQQCELKIEHGRGDTSDVRLDSKLVNSASGSAHVRIIMSDISLRKKAEERIRQIELNLLHATRLSTMGEMVTGIAHELTQPLSAIVNFAGACEVKLESSDCADRDSIQVLLTQISQQAMRCGDIIRHLRGFTLKRGNDREWIDLHDVIHDSVALIVACDHHRLSLIKCDLDDSVHWIHADKTQVQQVLVNLIQNAFEATSTISTPIIAVDLYRQNDRFRICVEDNGSGVDLHERSKLFDTFFSTKPNGMGMGLAISRTIVEAHDGTLRFEPSHSCGARFIVELRPSRVGFRPNDKSPSHE